MNKIVDRLKKVSLLIVLSFFIFAIVLNPEKYSNSCIIGLKLWAFTVLPSLLPFFFLTALLTKTGTLLSLSEKLSPATKWLFKQNGISIYAFLMSIISGYPVGSRIVYDLYSQNLLSKSQAEKLSVLSSTSGVIFIIGVVGISMFKSKTVGIAIYLAHILSAVLVGVIFRNHGDDFKDGKFILNLNADNALYESVYSSVISSLIVGGFISIFYVFTDALLSCNLLLPLEFIFEKLLFFIGGNKEISRAFTIGLIECTRGSKELADIGLSPLTASLSGALISFSGLSIIFQSLAFLQRASVNSWFFIKGKIIQTAITFLSLYVVFNLIL